MPTTPTHPGVYIEEMPSVIRPISAVPTSITAFVGRARRGPVNKPVRIQSFAEYSRTFGGLWQPSTMSYAVRQFFQNGGSEALIVRVFNGSLTRNTSTLTLPTADDGTLVLAADSPGKWGNSLRATVGHGPADRLDRLLFNIVIEELDRPGGTTAVSAEQFENLSTDPLSPQFVNTILAKQSSLVCVHSSAPIDKIPLDCALTVANANGSAIAPILLAAMAMRSQTPISYPSARRQ